MEFKMNRSIKRYVAMAGATLMLAGTLAMGEVSEVNASSWDDKISQTQTEINQKLKEVSNVKSELETLGVEIEEQEEEIKLTEEEIVEKEVEFENRMDQLGGQLQAMQKSEINKNIIVTVLSSDNIADAINTFYQVSLIKDASEKNIKDTQEESDRLDSLKEELVVVKEELGNKKVATEEVKGQLDSEITSLEKTLAENKRQKAEEVKRAEEARKKALAQKEAEKNVKTASSSKKNVSVGDSKPSPAPAAAEAKSGWMTFESTAYSTNQPGLSTHTAMGVDLRQNPRVVAVDPSVIPLGTKIEIEGMGVYLAADTGGAIKGRIIDVHFTDVSKLRPWGRRNINIRIVE